MNATQKKDNNKTITISKALAEEILARLISIQNEGPLGFGWKSNELIDLVVKLQEILGIPKEKPSGPDRKRHRQ